MAAGPGQRFRHDGAWVPTEGDARVDDHERDNRLARELPPRHDRGRADDSHAAATGVSPSRAGCLSWRAAASLQAASRGGTVPRSPPNPAISAGSGTIHQGRGTRLAPATPTRLTPRPRGRHHASAGGPPTCTHALIRSPTTRTGPATAPRLGDGRLGHPLAGSDRNDSGGEPPPARLGRCRGDRSPAVPPISAIVAAPAARAGREYGGRRSSRTGRSCNPRHRTRIRAYGRRRRRRGRRSVR